MERIRPSIESRAASSHRPGDAVTIPAFPQLPYTRLYGLRVPRKTLPVRSSGHCAGSQPFLLQPQPQHALLLAIPQHRSPARSRRLPHLLQHREEDGVPVLIAQELLRREADAFQNLVPPEDSPRHVVEGHRQALNLIAAFDFGARVQIAMRYLLHRGMQNLNGPDQTGRIEKRDQQTQAAAQDGQRPRALIRAPHALVVSIERQTDMNPPPRDAAVIEGEGVLKDAPSEKRRDTDGTIGRSCCGPPGVAQLLGSPGVAVNDQREAVVFGDHHVVDRVVAGQDLHCLIHHGGVILRDRRSRRHATNRNGHTPRFRFQAQLELALLFRNDHAYKHRQGDQRDQPSEQRNAQSDAFGETHTVSCLLGCGGRCARGRRAIGKPAVAAPAALRFLHGVRHLLSVRARFRRRRDRAFDYRPCTPRPARGNQGRRKEPTPSPMPSPEPS